MSGGSAADSEASKLTDNTADEDDAIMATQPVLNVLLDGVVAYVEVRSGHDNRSRGVKAKLRQLGATVVDSISKDVTHVIFNQGLPSTYKKAKKFECHLVSVLWIAACEEQLIKVSEAGYPPIGQEIYENPQSLKNIKKLKSMQPDFDEEESERKAKLILKRLKRRQLRAKTTDKTSQAETSSSPTKGRRKMTVPGEKKPTRRKRKENQPKSKSSKKALTDITQKSLVPTSETPLLQESFSSSSSVVFCGNVEAGPSRQFKPAKVFDGAPISREDFVDGLNDIVLSLSHGSDSQNTAPSPWKKNPNANSSSLSAQASLSSAKCEKSSCVRSKGFHLSCSPRRSPRLDAQKSPFKLSPRRSPRNQVQTKMFSKNSGGNVPEKPEYSSASAAIFHRRKRSLKEPSVEDFEVLSHESGDMPTIDEIAKTRKMSIKAGDDNIPLSQIVRSYNAVAQAKSQNSYLDSNSLVTKDQERGSTDEIVIDREEVDFQTHAEPEKFFASTRTSDSGSSSSTRVLIDGKDKYDFSHTSDVTDIEQLPNSAPNKFEDQEHLSEKPVNECERQPSPVFVIKKVNFRRAMKKKSSKSSPHRRIDSPPQEDNCSEKEITKECNMTTCGSSCATNQDPGGKKGLLSPVDYINSLVLPKFSSLQMNQPIDVKPCRSTLIDKKNFVKPTIFEAVSDIKVKDHQRSHANVATATRISENCLHKNTSTGLSAGVSSLNGSQSVTTVQMQPTKRTSERKRKIVLQIPSLERGENHGSTVGNDKVPKVTEGFATQKNKGRRKSPRLQDDKNKVAGEVKANLGNIFSTNEEPCNSEEHLSRNLNHLVVSTKQVKKKSEVYEDDSDTNTSVKSKNQEFPSTAVREKTKGQKNYLDQGLVSSKTSCPAMRRASQRSGSTVGRSMSESDSSPRGGRTLERKSSEEARKRMARSVSRSHPSDHLKIIVCTFLTSSEQNGIEQAGETLEGWRLEQKVTSHTTHVINSGPKRTLNMLKGMVRGCWLVDQKWMIDSSKSGNWLNEEDYELTEFSPAVQYCRSNRHALGKAFKHKLFEKLGPVFVSPKIEKPPAKDVRELMELCGANLQKSPKDAKVIVGCEDSKKGVVNVSAVWVLDCITQNKILPFA